MDKHTAFALCIRDGGELYVSEYKTWECRPRGEPVIDREREAFMAGWKSGWYVRDNAIDDDTAEKAYERWKDGRDG